MAEMLVQSSEEETRLLPALPDAWPEGTVQGRCTRSGYEISIEWKLTAFTAAVDGDGAVLVWTTASETNNAGFHVEYAANVAGGWHHADAAVGTR